MKYRALIVCGNDLASLEPDYEKKYNLIVDDPELDTLYDPTQFGPSANAYHFACYEVECKFCKEYIRMPASVREISLSARAYMNFNTLGMNHRIQVVHLDPIITEDDDVFNVREDTGDEYGVLGDSGPLTLTMRERRLKKSEEDNLKRETQLKERYKRTEKVWMFVITCLLVSAVLKFFDIILKALSI